MKMKTTLGHLRTLIREAYHDTQVAPTMSSELGPAGHDPTYYPTIQSDDTIDNKVNLIIKALTRMGRHVKASIVKRYVDRLDPRDALVVPAEELAKIILKHVN